METNNKLTQLASRVTEAAALDLPEYKGMLVDFTGVLSHAARALRALAVPPTTTDVCVIDEHEDRLSEEQPILHAHMLEQLVIHLGTVTKAMQAGDVKPLRQFLEIYRVD